MAIAQRLPRLVKTLIRELKPTRDRAVTPRTTPPPIGTVSPPQLMSHIRHTYVKSIYKP